jgi:hypothetical protein
MMQISKHLSDLQQHIHHTLHQQAAGKQANGRQRCQLQGEQQLLSLEVTPCQTIQAALEAAVLSMQWLSWGPTQPACCSAMLLD